MKLRFSSKFDKQYHRAPAHIIKAIDKRLALFLSDPFDLQLHNHALSGQLKGLRSINITGDWRALYTEDGDTVTFEPTSIF